MWVWLGCRLRTGRGVVRQSGHRTAPLIELHAPEAKCQRTPSRQAARHATYRHRPECGVHFARLHRGGTKEKGKKQKKAAKNKKAPYNTSSGCCARHTGRARAGDDHRAALSQSRFRTGHKTVISARGRQARKQQAATSQQQLRSWLIFGPVADNHKWPTELIAAGSGATACARG